MFTANDNFRRSHDLLFEEDANIHEATVSCVENYLENRRIWDELNYYKDHGRTLGLHPVFEVRNELIELRKLNSADLARKRNNIYINIGKTSKLIASGDQPQHTEKRKHRLAVMERLINEIDAILKSR